MKNRNRIGLLITAVCLAVPAHAADIRWSGFGTLGVGTTLDDDATYRTNAMAGANDDQNGDLDDELSYDALSLVALQANANLGDGLTATVQIRATGSDNWDTGISWAYLSYDLTPTLKVQAGRKLIPIYSYTDSIDIGYTYHWIRPPADVYSVPANKYDGVNLMYQTFFGDWELSANGLAGRINDDEDAYGEVTPLSYRVWGGSVETTLNDWATFRLAGFAYENFDLPVALPGDTTLEQFDAEYYGAAVKLRPGNWFIVAEYTWYTVDPENLFGLDNGKPINDLDSAWYASAAYTMGKWTPHLTYSAKEFKDEGAAIGSEVVDTSTIIIGARYDFHPSSSLKMEYHIFTDDTTTGGVSTPRFGNKDDETDAIQLAIDFIF